MPIEMRLFSYKQCLNWQKCMPHSHLIYLIIFILNREIDLRILMLCSNHLNAYKLLQYCQIKLHNVNYRIR